MKLNLLRLIILISFPIFSQSSLSVDVNQYYYAAFGEECIAELDITNTSSQDINVNVTRTVNTDISNYFCWGITCYPPNADESFSSSSNNSVLITSGETITGEDSFKGYVNNLPIDSSLIINYCFWVDGDPEDSICVDLTYTNEEIYVSLNDFSATPTVFPNPVNKHLQIRLKDGLTSYFLLYDMLGNHVLQEKIESTSTINTEEFQAGIYFYSFLNQGQVSEVHKLVISH